MIQTYNLHTTFIVMSPDNKRMRPVRKFLTSLTCILFYGAHSSSKEQSPLFSRLTPDHASHGLSPPRTEGIGTQPASLFSASSELK